MNYLNHLDKVVTIEEYYMHVGTAKEGKMQFVVNYNKYSGHTQIEVLPDYNKKLSDFAKWLNERPDLNTRFNNSNGYKVILVQREKRIVEWALEAMQRAYNQYYREKFDGMRGM